MFGVRTVARGSKVAFRRPRQTRTFFGVNAKNPVPKEQTHYQQNGHLHGADNPTYLKGKGDGITNAVGGAFFLTSVLLMFRGHYKMANGRK